ncbi:MAG: hypothetical protein G01um101493_240 [Microgenomates group bacterium Gr01-1014_93]|nr:MAG: hypothetical protein G01um101493_240 [Microgenomates group bacterium Gr01-1014_93]
MSESGTPEQETGRGNFFTSSIQRIFGRQIVAPEDLQQLRPREEIESDIQNQFKSMYRSTSEEAEVSYQPLMQEFSQVLLRELKGLRGKRGLMLIIDDNVYEIDTVKRRLTEHARRDKVNYVIAGLRSGVAGIVLYQEFKKSALNEKVVVFMDGLLVGLSLSTGMEVLDRMAQNTKQNGLPMPFIVGESGDSSLNRGMSRAYPHLYLGAFGDGEQTLKIVDSKL